MDPANSHALWGSRASPVEKPASGGGRRFPRFFTGTASIPPPFIDPPLAAVAQHRRQKSPTDSCPCTTSVGCPATTLTEPLRSVVVRSSTHCVTQHTSESHSRASYNRGRLILGALDCPSRTRTTRFMNELDRETRNEHRMKRRIARGGDIMRS